MSFQFNAESILEIGVRIETNGRSFYRKAAESFSDPQLQGLFRELADWESQHIELFRRMQAELPREMKADDLFDPQDELALYLQSMADSHVFTAPPDRLFGPVGTDGRAPTALDALDALDTAIGFEKDSVVYYSIMKKMVPGPGRERIEALVDEELRHIAILERRKKELSA